MNNDVIELVSVLDDNGMNQAAESIRSTLEYIEAMQNKLDEMIIQVDEMRKELKYYNDMQNRSLGEKLKDGAIHTKDKTVEVIKVHIERAEIRINSVKLNLIEAKNTFVNGVRDSLTAIKTRGKQGLNAIIGITHIKQAFSAMKKNIDEGIRETVDTIDRLTELGNELRKANEMKKNSFRSFRGKDTKEYDHTKDSIFSIVSAGPWKMQKMIYKDINDILDKGIQKMEGLAASVADYNRSKAEDRGEGVDETIGTSASPELIPSVAEKKNGYGYNDDSFENYMQNAEQHKIDGIMNEKLAPEKKPNKR